MTGTEKQIAWATEIKNANYNAINREIERITNLMGYDAKSGADVTGYKAEIAKYDSIKKLYDKMFSAADLQSAGAIISKKDKIPSVKMIYDLASAKAAKCHISFESALGL